MESGLMDDNERVKAFIRVYGSKILYILLAVVVAIGGFFYYRHYEARQSALAAALYDEMLGATAQHRYGLAEAAGIHLEKDFKKTPYAGLGALLLARIDYMQNKEPAAITDLKFAVNHGRQMVVRMVARLRLAQLLLAEGHPHKAWVWVNISHPMGFQGLVAGMQGEILAQEGQSARARTAFTLALKHINKTSTWAALWRLERAQLPAAT